MDEWKYRGDQFSMLLQGILYKVIRRSMATNSVDQCMYFLTRLDPEYEDPKIDWLILVLPVTNMDYGKPYPSIKSRE